MNLSKYFKDRAITFLISPTIAHISTIYIHLIIYIHVIASIKKIYIYVISVREHVVC